MARLMKKARLVKNAATHIKTRVINTMSKAKFDFSKHFEGRYKISTDLSARGPWSFEVKWKLDLLFYTRGGGGEGWTQLELTDACTWIFPYKFALF
jgi:hypothetical protein